MERYNIDPPEFLINQRFEVQGGIQYDLSAADLDSICPICNSHNISRNGTRYRLVRDLPEYGTNVGLRIRVQKYLCQECHYSWTHHFRSVMDDAKITVRMRDYIAKQALQKPFDQIAKELSVGHSTVKRAFEEYTDLLAAKYVIHAPTVLGIDENHLGGNYRAVFTDVENRLILDILPKRSKPVIKQ